MHGTMNLKFYKQNFDRLELEAFMAVTTKIVSRMTWRCAVPSASLYCHPPCLFCSKEDNSPPKFWHPPTKLHGVAFQKTTICTYINCLKGLLKHSILPGLTEMIRAATNKNRTRSHTSRANKSLSAFQSTDMARINQWINRINQLQLNYAVGS